MKEIMGNYKKGNRVYKYIIVFVIPIICMVIHMVMKDCYPFGKFTILLGDANAQYYSFFMELSDRLRNGNSLFFSWDAGLGYDFYSNFFYYLASPFNIIALLFGKTHMELGMVITMLVQVGMCGVTMLYYLAHTKRNRMKHGIFNDLLCILFATAYSMCDFIIAYQYNIIWLISLLMMPLVMLGIEIMAEKSNVKLYFVSLTIVFITNFYFAWFICIFAVVWFIDQKKDSIKDFFKKFGRFAVTSIVSALCSAIVLVPCYIAVLLREDRLRRLSDSDIDMFGNFANYLQSFFWGHEISIKGNLLYTNNNYIGLFIFVLCICYMFNKNIELKSRIKRLLEIIVFSICLNWKVAIYVLHGFSFPHAYSNRFTFFVSILFIISAFENVMTYESIKLKWISIIFAIIGIITGFVFAKNDNVQSMVCYLGSILIMAYILLLLIFERKKSIKRTSLLLNIIIIGFLELITNFFVINGDSFEISKDKASASSKWEQVYENIPSDDMERKTSWILSQNNALYSETNLFASSINTNLIWLFDNVGLVYQNNGGTYGYRGATPVTSLMFNVRNVLADNKAYYGGYKQIAAYYLLDDDYGIDETYGVYSTDYTAGLGYLVPDDILNLNFDRNNPFEVQNEYIKAISGQENVFTKVDIDSLEEFDVHSYGCMRLELNNFADTIKSNSKNVFNYQNVCLDPDANACLVFSFVVPRDMHLYIYIQDTKRLCSRIYIDNEAIGSDSVYPVAGEMLDLGELKAGQSVCVEAFNWSAQLDKSITYIDFYEYHDNVMKEVMESLDDKTLILETVEDTYIKGSINAVYDGVLYTSIPYYRGFTAYVDGIKTDIIGIADNALIGIEVPEGEHTIEFKYITYGFIPALIMTCTGVCIVIIYFIICKKRKKTGEYVK